MDISDTSALRAHLNRRLQAQAERLMDALEAVPTPETHVEVQRMARALMLVAKAVDQVIPQTPEDAGETPIETKTAVDPVPDTGAEVVKRPCTIAGWDYDRSAQGKRAKRRERKRGLVAPVPELA